MRRTQRPVPPPVDPHRHRVGVQLGERDHLAEGSRREGPVEVDLERRRIAVPPVATKAAAQRHALGEASVEVGRHLRETPLEPVGEQRRNRCVHLIRRHQQVQVTEVPQVRGQRAIVRAHRPLQQHRSNSSHLEDVDDPR